MTVSASVKLVGLKAGEVFLDENAKNERLQKFMASQASKMVEEFGKLKGSFMKVGQMLSVYGEYYLPPEINKILKQLQSESKPVGWAIMEKAIRKNLGSEVMAKLDIDPVSISSASMGQVYKAVRKSDGKILALKVQCPGVDRAIEHDLQGIKSLFNLFKIIPTKYDFDGIFDEIKTMLKSETDYRKELAQILKFQELLKSDNRFIIPEVFEEFSNKRILCMSFEGGLAVDSDEISSLPQKNKNMLGAAIIDLLFREIFVWRLVQTDSHFGNYRIRLGHGDRKDRIVLYDFGAIRKLPKRYVDPFTLLVKSALDDQRDDVIRQGVKLGFLLETDSDENKELFVNLCCSALIAFGDEYANSTVDGSESSSSDYCWGETDLIHQLTELARDTVFAFKFRPPPRESVFLNRKIIGTYFFMRQIHCQFGPQKLLLQRLEEQNPS
jgi:predicted unusual protein kinase regulating ubiquinone biosynthesis (AarF/ABC1/UbiB family)